MPALLTDFLDSLLATIVDVLPIAFIVLIFQLAVLRKVPPNPVRLAVGFGYVVLGLSLFLLGLERALFPLGETMAQQLTSAEVIGVTGSAVEWSDYLWVYAFAAAIGFATTVAEPALIAVALKAGEVSGGTLKPWGLRLAVAVGVGLSIAVGTFRIVTGHQQECMITHRTKVDSFRLDIEPLYLGQICRSSRPKSFRSNEDDQ